MAPGVTQHMMDEAGEVRITGRPAATPPTATWLSRDVWSSVAYRAFTGALLGSPTLQWVQTSTAGVDASIFGALMERGIALSTSHGQAVGIAEYLLAEVLDIDQRGDERRAAQAVRAWRPMSFREIAGTRWLIIGYGSIGPPKRCRIPHKPEAVRRGEDTSTLHMDVELPGQRKKSLLRPKAVG